MSGCEENAYRASQKGIRKVKVLYSRERCPKKVTEARNGEIVGGSISFVPSVAGMLIAGEVVRDILTENGKGLNKNRKIEERTCERRNETEIYRNSRKQQSAFDEPMSQHTTFRIGGPADVFAMPEIMNRSGKC